ncbi:two component regulator three y domain-containing protein [Fulvivirga sp. RKSG066]|uniref:helix-turn-helix and ligand-binding sensor domain-containing protein n=1 Tax=Fulvivirga aurantia TaxID=2529383 RepID=UPI0012BD1E6B|nr:triple tyrosine motif-containing protein [Fulvivirga aurantia]MTI22815.1 two component regulator three y domain-containing protein [Fulvivirga aurantia]
MFLNKLGKVCFGLFIIIIQGSFTVSAQRLQGLPFTKYYSTQEYEGGIQNWAITQNNEGLIYVANNFGLLEYDGTNWNRFELPTETKMRDVHIARNGRTYIASQGDFGYYSPAIDGSMVFTSLADSLPQQYRNFDETWKVFESSNDIIIFCTFRQIFMFNKDRLQRIIEPTFAPENFHWVNHTLFVNQLETGLTYLDGDSLRLFDQGDYFRGKTITGILPLANNHLLIATGAHGIYTYDGTKYSVWNNDNNQAFSEAFINNTLRLSNGNVAIGTQNDGLFITTANGEILYHLNKGHGLNNRTILSMYEDVLGNLWVGHNNGLTTIELNVPFTLISEQSDLPGTGYTGFLSPESIYLGTNNGLYRKQLKENTKLDFNFVDNTEGQVYNIQSIDNLLILGHHQGTFLLDGASTQQVSDILGAWTFLKLKTNPEYIIGGTYKGLLLFKKTPRGLSFVRKIRGFDESSRVMEQDASGNIWMTHGYKGVYRLNLNDDLDSVSVKYYGVDAGLPSNILINVWKINNELVFSTESQIYSYNEATDSFIVDDFFAKYFEEESHVSYLEQDPLGNIYYLAPDNMGVLEKLPNGTYIKKSKIFNRLKGLLNDDLQNLSALNANNVLYGAKEGFILYTKNNSNLDELDFQALIRRVTITNNRDSVISTGYYSLDGNVSSAQEVKNAPVLNSSHNSIRIEYSAAFFHSSDNTLYQYKLSNNKWSEWTSKTDKEYTNLIGGDYTFTVRAKNIYDKVSKEASFSFTVLPPWYKSQTAYVFYVLGVASVLLLVFYFLDTRHKKEKKLMALKQKKEINRIDNELRSSEEQIQILKNEKLRGEVESKNKELATSTMHLLNKNSFINSVKHNISTIIKRSKNQEVKKELNKIMGNIDKNMAEDNDWEHFAIHFDQVHGDFTKRIQDNYPDLTPQEMKLSAYLRMNLSTKEIAHLLNISVRGVEIARYRLRKKLNLERAVNLQEFILKY